MAAAAPGRESVFERVADYVSAAMGRPVNIMVWAVAVIGWTLLFALGGHKLQSGSFLPPWFVSLGYNFPLNLTTTVAELFIGFLVAAAANRSERNLHVTLAAIGKQETQISDVEGKLALELDKNTALTQQVHELAAEIHDITGRQAVALGGLAHINAELNIIRQAVAPAAPNPAQGTDTGIDP